MVEYKGGKVVITTNNAQLPITHIGDATCVPRFSKNEAQLQHVFHVPGMKKNLLSVSQLTLSGGPDDVKIYRSIKPYEKSIMMGHKLNSIYVMLAESTYVKKTCRSETSDLWHA